MVVRGYQPDVHEAALALDWPRFEPLAEAAPGSLARPHPIGGSAMAAAAIGGAGSEIWRVYRYGADPDARPNGPTSKSPLRLALEYPLLETAELTAATLVGNGARPDPEEADGVSPLHVAAARGSRDLVEMLVRLGADPEARDRDGMTPRERAAAAGHRDVAELLVRHREIPRTCTSSRRAYDVDGRPYQAADLGAFSLLTIQKTVGAAHFDRDATRRTVEAYPDLAKAVASTTEGAVEACAHTGQIAIVDDLLARGAAYSVATATVRGDVRRVRELLGEDPRRVHERGAHDFALLWYPVIAGGHLELAELLLDAGAEVERQHRLGTTALHWAARGGQLDMAALLCERGADVDRIGRQFGGVPQTPLELARDRDHEAMARWLLDRGASRRSSRERIGA